MIKSILAASAVLFAATPAAALDFTVSRGAAFAIRSCPIEGVMDRGICYNQETEWEVFPFTGTNKRVIEIDCEGRVLRQIGKDYCPFRSELEPAPFL